MLCLSNYEDLKPNKPSIKSSALKHCIVRSLVTILYSDNLDMTNSRTDEMVFFRNLTKIDTDENKAINSRWFHYESE